MTGVVMNEQSKLKIFFAFAAIYIIWGSTYLALLIGVQSMPPFVLSALRFLIAGLVLYGYCLWRGEAQPDFASVKKNSVCGILMLFGGAGSVAWAEQYLPSGLAAIIVTALPFWFVLLDKRQWPFYFSNKLIIAGLLIGFIGVAVLVGFDKSPHSVSGNSTIKTYGTMALIAGGISWTIGSLYSKYKPAKNSVLMNGAIQLLSAGLFTFLVSFLSGELNAYSFSNTKKEAWSALLYLIIMGSVIAYLSYLWLLKVRPTAQVSTYVYVNPVVAVLLGAIIIREPITWLQIIGLIIILSGVFMVNIARYKRVTQKV